MTIDELWDKHALHVMLNDLFKARKDAEMGKIRLKALLDYCGADTQPAPQDAGPAKRPSRVQPPKANDRETLDPFNEQSEKIEQEVAQGKFNDNGPAIPLPENETPADRRKKMLDDLRERFKDQLKPFTGVFPQTFPVSEMPVLLDEAGLKWQISGHDWLTNAPNNGNPKWLVKFAPKM